MIQDIHPHRFDIGFTPRPPTGDDYLVFLSGEKVALRRGPGEEGFFPTFASLASWLPDSPEFTYLFRLDDRAFYYAGFSLPGETRLDFHSSQLFRELPPPWMGFAGITAHHLANWYANNRFCGACGGRMTPKEEERALACPACATSV
ncbi:MAG: NAD(+) diphosphatase, partial [Planctomycetota bacterium]|nr:NAD(+) diphosphatase [Planctomycetota bacterium]